MLIPGHTPQESRFPGSRNVLGFASSGCSPSLFPPWIEVCLGSRTHSLCWWEACFPGRADLRSQLSMVNVSCRWDRRVAAGQKWGPVESSPGRLLPSCSTADKWILETDGSICKPIEEGRFNGEVNSTYLLCQQMDKLSTYYPATRYTFNYLCLKFQLGMVIWV